MTEAQVLIMSVRVIAVNGWMLAAQLAQSNCELTELQLTMDLRCTFVYNSTIRDHTHSDQHHAMSSLHTALYISAVTLHISTVHTFWLTI